MFPCPFLLSSELKDPAGLLFRPRTLRVSPPGIEVSSVHQPRGCVYLSMLYCVTSKARDPYPFLCICFLPTSNPGHLSCFCERLPLVELALQETLLIRMSSYGRSCEGCPLGKGLVPGPTWKRTLLGNLLGKSPYPWALDNTTFLKLF